MEYLPQWGGRYLWHLKGAAQLRLYWQATAAYRERKIELLDAFKWQLLKLPFANLKISSPDVA